MASDTWHTCVTHLDKAVADLKSAGAMPCDSIVIDTKAGCAYCVEEWQTKPSTALPDGPVLIDNNPVSLAAYREDYKAKHGHYPFDDSQTEPPAKPCRVVDDFYCMAHGQDVLDCHAMRKAKQQQNG